SSSGTELFPATPSHSASANAMTPVMEEIRIAPSTAGLNWSHTCDSGRWTFSEAISETVGTITAITIDATASVVAIHPAFSAAGHGPTSICSAVALLRRVQTTGATRSAMTISSGSETATADAARAA